MKYSHTRTEDHSVGRYRIIDVCEPERVTVKTPSGEHRVWREETEAITREMDIDQTFEIMKEDQDVAGE